MGPSWVLTTMPPRNSLSRARKLNRHTQLRTAEHDFLSLILVLVFGSTTFLFSLQAIFLCVRLCFLRKEVGETLNICGPVMYGLVLCLHHAFEEARLERLNKATACSSRRFFRVFSFNNLLIWRGDNSERCEQICFVPPPETV